MQGGLIPLYACLQRCRSMDLVPEWIRVKGHLGDHGHYARWDTQTRFRLCVPQDLLFTDWANL